MTFRKIVENLSYCNIFSFILQISINDSKPDGWMTFIQTATSTLAAIVANIAKQSSKEFFEQKIINQIVPYVVSIAITPLCANIFDIKKSYYDYFLNFEQNAFALKVNFINSVVQTYYIDQFLEEYLSITEFDALTLDE